MLEQSDLGLVVTPAARDKILARLREPGFEGKIPALMLEETNPATLVWRITYYDREAVESAEFKALLLKSNDIEFIVPQWNFSEFMKGATLHWTGATFTVNGVTEIPVTRRPKR